MAVAESASKVVPGCRSAGTQSSGVGEASTLAVRCPLAHNPHSSCSRGCEPRATPLGGVALRRHGDTDDDYGILFSHLTGTYKDFHWLADTEMFGRFCIMNIIFRY